MSWLTDFLRALGSDADRDEPKPAPAPAPLPFPAPQPVPIPVRFPRTINRAGLELIKSFEGFRLVSYMDISGVLTVGYGHTGSTVPPAGTAITNSEAEAFLLKDLAQAEAAVDAAALGATDNQFAAMVSLAFNIGIGAFRRSSVLQYHNIGKVIEAADAFLLWDKAHVNGRLVEVPGLVRRRKAEMKLYLTPDENSSHMTMST